MAYLLAKDTVTGAEGSVVVTKEGRNYVVAGMRNITTNAEIQSSDMRVIRFRFGDTGLPGYGLLRMPPDRHRAPLRSEQ